MESSRQPSTLSTGFDPRKPIYRDPFNEVFVLVLSAVSASVVIPVVLLIVGAFAGSIPLVLFVVVSMIAELVIIFGLARPQMLPRERVGWALLWAFTSGALAVCFWELVFSNVI